MTPLQNFKALSRRVQTAQSQLTRMRSHMRAVLSQTMTSLQHSQTSGAQLAAHVAAYQHAQSAQTAARAAVATAQTDVSVVAAQNAAVLKLLQNLVQQLRDSPNAAAALLESAAALVQRSDAAAHLVHQAAAHAATGAHTPADMIAAMHEVAELVKREFALEEEFVRNHVVAAQTVDAAHQSAAETARLRVQHVTEDIDNLNRKLNKQFTDAMYFEDQLGLLTKLRDMLVKRLQVCISTWSRVVVANGAIFFSPRFPCFVFLCFFFFKICRPLSSSVAPPSMKSPRRASTMRARSPRCVAFSMRSPPSAPARARAASSPR